MFTNHLLAEKDRVQRELSEAAGEEMDKYSELVHQLFLKVQQESGLTFRYGAPEGFVPPVIRPLTLETPHGSPAMPLS